MAGLDHSADVGGNALCPLLLGQAGALLRRPDGLVGPAGRRNHSA